MLCYRIENGTQELTSKDKALIDYVARKRLTCKLKQFQHLHEGIVPMLSKLKKNGIKVGLISNCFSEEVVAIRQSPLFQYFDEVVLSYEVGMMKPSESIYQTCMERLGVLAKQCVYIGDGGSQELDGATLAGMRAAQAGWYFGPWNNPPRQEKFPFLQLPDEVFKKLRISYDE